MSDHTATPADVNAEAPYTPTEADLLDYQAWCREREDRLMDERLAGPTLVEKLRAAADRYLDDLDDDLAGLGAHLWALADEAEALEASYWEQFLDRRDAMIDAREAR